MRESLFFLVLFLVGCDGNGVESVIVPDTGQPPAQPPVQHAPEITDVVLTPDTVNYMEGDGSVVVTAEITFRDDGSDVETLWVEKPDGTTAEFGVINHSENHENCLMFD